MTNQTTRIKIPQKTVREHARPTTAEKEGTNFRHHQIQGLWNQNFGKLNSNIIHIVNYAFPVFLCLFKKPLLTLLRVT